MAWSAGSPVPMTNSSDTTPERDPAEIEITDNSSGAAPDLGLVEQAEKDAAELEAEAEAKG